MISNLDAFVEVFPTVAAGARDAEEARVREREGDAFARLRPPVHV